MRAIAPAAPATLAGPVVSVAAGVAVSVAIGVAAGVAAGVGACARPPAHVPEESAASHASQAPRELRALPEDRVRRYTIWLGGARIGTATELEAWSAAGVTLSRTESLRFLREDTEVSLETAIEVVADAALVPVRVAWTATPGGRATAVRGAGGGPGGAAPHAQPDGGAAAAGRGGWTVVDGAGAPRALPDAVPAELVPLLARRDGGFAGRVFLPARGFVVGEGRVVAVAPRRLVARLWTGGAVSESTIDVGADGSYARIVDGDGVIALLATEAQAAEPFPRVDLVAATAIPIAGEPGREPRLVIEGAFALPAVPGQSARAHPDGLELALSPRLAGGLPPPPLPPPAAARGPDRTREIGALVSRVRARIAPDLAAGPAPAAAAAAATAGDCTTYALAYAAHAAQAGIPTRVVTGFRVDGDRLVRHRWAVSWTGRAWIAVDAAFGTAPAGGDLVGLAVHDADDAGLVAGEASLTQLRGAAWR